MLTSRPRRGLRAAALGATLLSLAACGGGSAGADSGDDPIDLAQPAPPWTWGDVLQVEPDRIRLMPLGDSITLGAGAVGGYRLPLFVDLLADGVPRLEFVGSRTSNWPSNVPITRHEGRGGWTLEDLLAFPGDQTFAPSTLETLLEAERPSLILLHAGTNDAFEYATWQESSARLAELLDRVHQWDPTCTVLVAQLIPTGDPAVNLCIDWYNREVARIVHERAQQGAPLQLVDMQAACPEFSSGDGTLVHPDLFCYLSMAAAWRAGMESMGEPVPEPPTVEPPAGPAVAVASSFEGGYLPDLAVTGVGLDGGLHRAELDVPLGWRSQPFLETPGGIVGEEAPSLTIQLEEAFDVSTVDLWNGRVLEPDGAPPTSVEAARRIEVETSADGLEWTTREPLAPAPAPVRAEAPPERFEVDWPATRFVRLTVVETHGEITQPGGALRSVALAEVRLRGLPAQ